MGKSKTNNLINKTNIESLIHEAHLELGNTTNIEIRNVLINPHKEYDDMIMEFVDFMRQPENFWYTCYYLFQVDLLPFQVAILQELWSRKFPMFVGSRGCGKTYLLSIYALLKALFTPNLKVAVLGAAFRQSKFLFEYMETIWKQSPILRNIIGTGQRMGPRRDIDRCTFSSPYSEIVALPIGDGCLTGNSQLTLEDRFSRIDELHPDAVIAKQIRQHNETVWDGDNFEVSDSVIYNGKKNTKEIITQRGYIFEGTLNHKIKVLDGTKIVWKRLDKLKIGDYALIDRSYRWHNGTSDISVDDFYTLGLMIADGCYTEKYRLGFATKDEELISALNKSFDDDWSQSSDNLHYHLCGIDEVDHWLDSHEMCQTYTKNKKLPISVLSASRKCMTACLQGLFDGDGTLQVSHWKGGTGIIISFSNTSKELVHQMQYILLHYGIISTVATRKRYEQHLRCYELYIHGKNVQKFYEEIGFRLSRKQQKLETGLTKRIRNRSGGDIIPNCKELMLDILKQYDIPRNDAFSLSKVKQRKNITQDFLHRFLAQCRYIKDERVTVLAELTNDNIFYDKITKIIDKHSPTYDIHVPKTNRYIANGFVSHNSKIRGLRAGLIIADEYSSMHQEIFEVVIRGFASVSTNPAERVKDKSRVNVLKSLDLFEEAAVIEEEMGFGNQIIISGTAYYSFNHFFEYFERYRNIIRSGGNISYLEEHVFMGPVPEDFNWKDYSVIRLPHNLLPDGFLDRNTILQAQATMHKNLFDMEYNAVFAKDSEGFFRRSLIETCVTKHPIQTGDGPAEFTALIKGDPNKTYVIGIDPASESDNFAIVVLERHEHHNRIVYCWTVDRQLMRKRLKERGSVTLESFYAYCCRKIRELLFVFPCDHIGIDAQGGGVQIAETLHDAHLMKQGDEPMWPYVRDKNDEKCPFYWEKPDKPTDGEAGLHILHLVEFALPEFTKNANHGLRNAMERQQCLFPKFDPLILAEAGIRDNREGREYDTLEDCVMEIEELKNELTIIEHTQTLANRDKWDTPELQGDPNSSHKRKRRMRKDRYSALVIAHEVSRVMDTALKGQPYKFVGGYAGQERSSAGKLYEGPQHIVGKMVGMYGMGVSKHSGV